MALGPMLEKTSIADRTIVGELEAKIDAWLRNSWTPEAEGYALPFWIFWGSNHEAFVAMLARYRSMGWQHVSVVADANQINRLIFRS